MRYLTSLLCAAALLVSAGCGEYHEQITFVVPPNSDVMLAPLVGEAGSEGTAGADGEKPEIIYSKLIIIPTSKRDTGFGATAFTYQPDVWPVVTSRSPVDRVWTKWENKGTSTKFQAFEFESLDSINFSAGGVIIVRIADGDSATYRHRISRASLEQFVDRQVYPYLLGQLAHGQGEGRPGFNKLNFRVEVPETWDGDPTTLPQDCHNQCIAIFQRAEAAGIDHFKDYGVTIDLFGNIGGLHPENKERQYKLDEEYIALKTIQLEAERNKERVVRNRMTVALAGATREASQTRFEAQEANRLRQLFTNILRRERAINDAAMKWGGVTTDSDGEFVLISTGDPNRPPVPRGQLPTGVMPADYSPLSWMGARSIEQILSEVPESLDDELVGQAQARVLEIEAEHKRQREAEAEEAASAEDSVTPVVTDDAAAAPPVVAEDE